MEIEDHKRGCVKAHQAETRSRHHSRSFRHLEVATRLRSCRRCEPLVERTRPAEPWPHVDRRCWTRPIAGSSLGCCRHSSLLHARLETVRSNTGPSTVLGRLARCGRVSGVSARRLSQLPSDKLLPPTCLPLRYAYVWRTSVRKSLRRTGIGCCARRLRARSASGSGLCAPWRQHCCRCDAHTEAPQSCACTGTG